MPTPKRVVCVKPSKGFSFGTVYTVESETYLYYRLTDDEGNKGVGMYRRRFRVISDERGKSPEGKGMNLLLKCIDPGRHYLTRGKVYKGRAKDTGVDRISYIVIDDDGIAVEAWKTRFEEIK